MEYRLSYTIIVLIIISGVIFCEDAEENTSDDNTREIRDFDQYGWRAVGSFHEGDVGWIKRGEARNPDLVRPKRRRLRKRKRRPPIAENSEEGVQFIRRRIRPYRLEPWEEMNEEDIKPIIRRRKPQRFPSSEEIDEENSNNKEIIITEDTQNAQEKPLEASIFVEEKLKPTPINSSSADLKHILKQSQDKLSLSDILLQKSLTLSELLKDNEKVIEAHTEKPSPQTVPIFESTTELITKYRRLPPSVALKKENKNSVDDGPPKALSEKETMEAQRKRLSLLQPKENKIYSNIIKYDIVTEPTTERRIFVPVRSKHNDKENNLEIETTTEQKLTSTFKSTSAIVTPASIFHEKTTVTSTTPKLVGARSKLPTTNAKLRVTTNKVIEKESYALPIIAKPVKISISDVAGFVQSTTEKSEKLIMKKEFTTEGPMRISLDLETMFENDSIPYIVEVNPAHSNPELTTNLSDYQNETYVTAKQEIMEVMEDPISRQKLSMILETRNMTLEELVEQRERGSSQRHLADIFHNNTREPEPKEEPHVGHISPDFYNNLKMTNRQQKSTKFNEDSKVASSTASSTTEMQTSTASDEEILPTVKLESQGVETFPWKQLYPNLFSEANEDVDSTSADNVNEIIQRLENDSNYALNSANEGFFLNIPSGVKSALFVSLAIIGLSIVVFLAILVVFKMVHKKKTSLNYCSSLTTKFKPPMIMQGRPTTAIKTFMNETLGRKKNYYKSSLQSMSDEIWDSSKEKKESF